MIELRIADSEVGNADFELRKRKDLFRPSNPLGKVAGVARYSML